MIGFKSLVRSDTIEAEPMFTEEWGHPSEPNNNKGIEEQEAGDEEFNDVFMDEISISRGGNQLCPDVPNLIRHATETIAKSQCVIADRDLKAINVAVEKRQRIYRLGREGAPPSVAILVAHQHTMLFLPALLGRAVTLANVDRALEHLGAALSTLLHHFL